MPDTKKFSELDTAATVNDSDLLAISQGNSGSGFASMKTNVLALATKIVSAINFTNLLQTTDKTICGAINEAAASGGTDVIADEFDATSTYAVDDYCTHEGSLYKCTTAVTVAGTWNANDWTETLVMDEISSGGSGSSTLAGLSDVNLSSLANGQILAWDDTSSKWVNANQSGGASTFSGKALVMKTKTYTGTGTATWSLTFDEKPYAIFNIFGDGLNQSNKVLALPFMYGETTYMVASFSNSGMLFDSVSYSNNDLTITISGVDQGAAFNNEGSTYTVWYLVEENFNEFKEISGTLAAGSTSITLSDANITTSSTVEPFTSQFGLSPTDIVVSGNDYTAKQYLEIGSSIGPYIDTGLTSTRDTYCEIKFACTDNPTNNTWFFGAFSSVGIILGYQNSGIEGYLGSGGQLVAYDTSDHIVEIKADGIYLDGVKKQTGDWTQVPQNVPVYLFSRGGDNSKINNFKIYYAKIWQGSTLVRNYIPAEDNTTHEIGMLDLANGTLYTNDGTGAFVAGPTDSSVPQIGSVTLTFPAQSTNVNVKVRVS